MKRIRIRRPKPRPRREMDVTSTAANMARASRDGRRLLRELDDLIHDIECALEQNAEGRCRK
jgi:hypothetical protein